MKKSPDVSIIIVSWNTRDILRDCIQSIYDQAGDVQFEIIVVDNHSSDDSGEMVSRDFPEAALIQNKDNRGFSSANNQGIVQAKGRYVLLLNPDTIVHENAIEKAVSFIDAHKDTAVVGCRTLFQDGRLQYNCYTFPSLLNLFLTLTRLWRPFRRNRFFGRYRLTWWDYNETRSVDAVAGCFMLVRKEAIDEVGMMSEEYFMYSEDTDWCWRFNQRGWKIRFTPDAVITHLGDASGCQSPVDMNLQYRKSLLLFLRKKSGWFAGAVANLMFGVVAFINLMILCVQRLLPTKHTEPYRKKWQQSVAAVKFHWLGRLPRSS